MTWHDASILHVLEIVTGCIWVPKTERECLQSEFSGRAVG